MAILSILSVFFIISTVILLWILLDWHRQLIAMKTVLEDIKGGNLNRRIVVRGATVICQISYDINEIVQQNQQIVFQQRQAEQAYKQLVTNLSHDIKTPLASLTGYLEAVEKHLVVNDEKEEYLRIAYERAEYLCVLVNKLFEWVKLDAGEQKYEFSTVNFYEECRRLMAGLIPALESNAFQYDIQIPDEALPVLLDRAAFTRIFNNLVENVIHHSHGTKFTLTAGCTGDKAILQISDNGVGIPADEFNRVFERLYQCDPSRRSQGNGLGLAITKGLVAAHGGTISLQSIPEKATTFTVTFPRALP